MAVLAGLTLKGTQTVIRGLQFCCAGLILALYSYFLSVLADRNLNIPRWEKAVEGMSGAAVLYTIFAIILTCFLGGITFFAFLGTVLDFAFLACFVAIAILTRQGAHSCSGMVHTPLGYGNADTGAAGFGSDGFGFGSGENVTYAPNLKQACRMNKAVFAVSIIAAALFLLSALFDVFMARHHQREKRYGPSPANNYTSGSGRRTGLFSRNRKPRTTREAEARQAELADAGAGVGAVGYKKYHHNHNNDTVASGTATYATPATGNVRPSHDTAYSGATQTENYGYGASGTTTAAGANPYKYEHTTDGNIEFPNHLLKSK